MPFFSFSKSAISCLISSVFITVVMLVVLIAGNIKTECDGIEIYEKKNSDDYKKITNWIEII
jgi:hypothetical protein